MMVRRLAALVTGLVVLIPLTGQAVSAEEVKGRWDSLSLRDNRIGYYLILKPAAGSDHRYTGMIRFAYRDGREGPRMPLTAVVQDQQITLRAHRGRFDRQPGVLRGE